MADEEKLKHYQWAINKIDDHFEYSHESKKDQQKVHSILRQLTERLVELEVKKGLD